MRVWSAGCASGEEAYSLAVLLAEAFGEERFRESVKIYATDADNDAKSTNEELETTNQFLESILGSLQSAVAVLGTEMEVRAWNRQAEDLWGLRSDEVLKQHFLNLDIGFHVEQLRGPIRNLLAGAQSATRGLAPACAKPTWRLAPGTGHAGGRGHALLPGRCQVSARVSAGHRGLDGCTGAGRVQPRRGRPRRRAPAGC